MSDGQNGGGSELDEPEKHSSLRRLAENARRTAYGQESKVATTRIPLTSGPSKADLLRAAANPEEKVRAVFGTPQGILEAQIDTIEEIGIEGVDFTLWGHLVSRHLGGAVFTGTYNSYARTGRLALKVSQAGEPRSK
jgi:hypothetical protein